MKLWATSLCGLVSALTLVIVDGRVFNVRFRRAEVDYALESPSYPNNTPSLSYIDWRMTAPENQKIVLTCDDIRFLRRLGCTEGSLTIWDGATQINLCNVLSFFQRESRKNQMNVQFRGGWRGIGRVRCKARSVERGVLDALADVEDSRENGQGVGAKTTTCPCGWTNKQVRIVGGRETGINEYPFAVSFMTLPDKQRFCGGSIITIYHILSAAHCFFQLSKAIAVVVGGHDFSDSFESNSTRTIRVRHIILHEHYNQRDMKNDIALVIVAHKIEYNQKVAAVCLPSMKYNLLHRDLKALGWGLTSERGMKSNVLLKVNLKVIELSKCAAKYNYNIDLENPSQICTYGDKKDSCEGDSGGPLIYHDPEINRYVLVALVSYGKECASETPAVNVDVHFYTDWIETQINKHIPEVSTCHKID